MSIMSDNYSTYDYDNENDEQTRERLAVHVIRGVDADANEDADDASLNSLLLLKSRNLTIEENNESQSSQQQQQQQQQQLEQEKQLERKIFNQKMFEANAYESTNDVNNRNLAISNSKNNEEDNLDSYSTSKSLVVVEEEEDKFVNSSNYDEETNVNVESDDHLPRVQIELDKLNYANESINNLELELDESKKEYLRTLDETNEELGGIEKKLGSCVSRSRPYYEARVQLNEAKEKYFLAKHRFETAQELYVAAKNIQLYAEENLENFSTPKSSITSNSINNVKTDPKEKETLIKILEIAKIKVNDTELSKQSSDIEQIEAFKAYNQTKGVVETMEKDLRRQIEKSKKYFELKSKYNKELRFLFTKIEGLKSCLKEAKLAYQQSLNNLELISAEIHTLRQTNSISARSTTNFESLVVMDNNSSLGNDSNNNTSSLEKNEDENKANSTSEGSCCGAVSFSGHPHDDDKDQPKSPSSSTLSSSSSSSMSINGHNTTSTHAKSDQLTHTNTANPILEHQQSEEKEDYDLYFTSSQYRNDMTIKPLSSKKNSLNRSAINHTPKQHYNSQRSSSQSILSDEDVENIGLDAQLNKYKEEILNPKRKSTEENNTATSNQATDKATSNVNAIQNSSTASAVANTQSPMKLAASKSFDETMRGKQDEQPQTSSKNSRPQFRVPSLNFFSNTANKK